ncbi:MAG: hypothetical protein OEW84_03830 [Aigarchaeota archaeon]|nr:hypothetical protein [Aigarchaeota archaeon]
MSFTFPPYREARHLRDLDEIRRDVENFNGDIDREYYLNWAGLKDEMNLSVIYDRYANLFDPELIAEVRARRRAASEEEARRLRYLQDFLTSAYLTQRVKELTSRVETMAASESITVNGERMAFRLAAVKMANEADRAKRSRIFHARNQIIDKMNPTLKERMGMMHAAAESLGYESYLSLFTEIKRIDFQALSKIMERLISRTEGLYRDGMGDLFQRVAGVPLERGEKHDLAFIFRAKQFDPIFPKERLLHALKSTLARVGIDLDEQRNIELDVEERPKKSPRAFVAPIRVPSEIKLVIMPHGGHDDYMTLLHETGHAEHHAWCDAGLAVEYRYLGDVSVTESYAFLLEHLATNKSWLERFLGVKDAVAFLDFQRLIKLYFLRRYGAKISYELKLHSDGLEDMDLEYQRTLEAALVFRHSPSHYLNDVDDEFYCAGYLRAWIFEAQLREVLSQKFGEDWFTTVEAGGFLKELWSHGQEYDVDELARQLGYEGLSIDPLMREFLP